jgi:hypothetical protein
MKKRQAEEQECAKIWGQCGGYNYKGVTCCTEGECVKVNDYFYQCQKQ